MYVYWPVFWLFKQVADVNDPAYYPLLTIYIMNQKLSNEES